LSEKYYRPAIAVSVGDEASRASMRSIPEFDAVESLRGVRDLFHRFGGHPRAAGFTMSTRDLPSLRSRLTEAARKQLDDSELRPTIDIDCEFSPAMLDQETFDFMESLRPYGEGNPAPVFLTRGAKVIQARRVGRQRDHLKMSLDAGGSSWDAIAFRMGERTIAQGDRVDVVYNVGLNTWRGVTSLQLGVLDIRGANAAG
jgi:single-stranded-DNA-specific exonuclease